MFASDIIRLLQPSGLSPEQVATYFSVSNMTVRRWRQSPNTPIPLRHQSNIIQGIYRMVSEGKLANDDHVAAFLIQFGTHSVDPLAKMPGFDLAAFSSGATDSDRIVSGMRHVGDQPSTQSQVTAHLPRIKTFRTLGKSWKSSIDGLLQVIQNKQITVREKCVAFGGLFYLISVIDAIPDFAPVFGMVDDLAVLTIVMSYYALKKKSKQ